MEEERSSSLTVTIIVLLIAAVVALSSLASFSRDNKRQGEFPHGGSVVATSVTTSQVWQLQRDVIALRSDVTQLQKQLRTLRKDHEALASWTLQSLLASQSSDGANVQLAPLPKSDSDLPEPSAMDLPQQPTAPPRGFRRQGSWGDREITTMVDRLQLFPQQVDYVRPLLRSALEETREALKRMRADGTLTPEALIDERQRIQLELKDKLKSILTEEQMTRFDEMNKRADRYAEEGGRKVNQTGVGRPAPPPPAPTK